MSASASLLLAAAATAQPAYPVAEMLDSFKEVCFTRSEYGDIDQQYAAWKHAAETAGWTELVHPTLSSDRAEQRDYYAFYKLKGIDYAFISSMLGAYGSEPTSAIFKKQVAARIVYISMMATDYANPSVSECRLYDPLGDGVTSSPVSKDVLEAWSGEKVRRRGGVYGGKAYSWGGPRGTEQTIRVHFGYYLTPIPRWGDKFRPYAINGLVLVVSNYSLFYVT
jgi:hypothetical protein